MNELEVFGNEDFFYVPNFVALPISNIKIA